MWTPSVPRTMGSLFSEVKGWSQLGPAMPSVNAGEPAGRRA